MACVQTPVSDQIGGQQVNSKNTISDIVISQATEALLNLRSFASKKDLHKIKDLVEPLILEVLNVQFHDHNDNDEPDALHSDCATNKNCYSLSSREIDCLKWCTAGKTYWETGKILDISERTVVFHITSAKQKTNSVSLVQCVVKTMRAKII